MGSADLALEVADHPYLDVRVFETRFPRPLADMGGPALEEWLRPGARAPLSSDDGVREAVRRLLRFGGFKPTGRSKPASEYLIKAVGEGRLGAINAAVDCCNIVSLHSGLPISVVDADRLALPCRIAIAGAGASFVFNTSGQTIDVGGLLCLFDSNGPCANAVKDSQRTKTEARTVRTLSVIWGTKELPDRAARTEVWYRSLLESLEGSTQTVEIVRPAAC